MSDFHRPSILSQTSPDWEEVTDVGTGADIIHF